MVVQCELKIMVVQCELKIPYLGVRLVMPKSDGILQSALHNYSTVLSSVTYAGLIARKMKGLKENLKESSYFSTFKC